RPALGQTPPVEVRPRAAEAHPRAAEAHPRAVEGRTQAVEGQRQSKRRLAPPVRYVDRPGADLRLRRERSAKYLYFWAGHVNHEDADFLAVIDFDEGSPGYGRVVNMVPLPGPGATFNEPHHMHLSVD